MTRNHYTDAAGAVAAITASVYPACIMVAVDWPEKYVEIDGGARRNWYFTGKTGTATKSGLPSAEYRTPDGQQAWLCIDGTLSKEQS